MGLPNELFNLLKELTALQSKVTDTADTLLRIERKVDAFSERLTRLEMVVNFMKENVRSDISAELRSEFTQVKTVLELYESGRLKFPDRT